MLHKYKDTYPTLGSNCFIENSAQVIGDVVFGDDCSVWYNAVIRGDVNYIRIGNRTNIQDAAVLHVSNKTHPLVIENDVTIGHGAIIHGCTVKSYSLIGMGAKLLDGCVIEPYSLVAAGSLVRQDFTVPSRHLVAGVPAKVIRELSDEDCRGLADSAQHYVDYMKDYT